MRRTAVLGAVAYIAAVALVLISQPASSQGTLDGKSIFRFDTFGDEQLWTNTLHLERAIATVSPATALGVGLKVDVDALPASVVNALKANLVNLNDPAVTLQLLSANAVVGVMGKVNNGHLDSIGVTCALCHSTVDNSLTRGIGHRQDGWPNRDLDVGAIVALSTALTREQRAAVTSWGKGKFDPRLQAFNGTTFIALNRSTLPVVIPPAYGLQRVGFETVTADGPISYWNNYVGVSQMGGHGNFSDLRPRINLTITQTPPDLVTPKLAALRDYQLSLPAPEPPNGSFDRAAAGRSTGVFNGIARCSSCHRPPAYTDVVRGPSDPTPLLHDPSETGMEPVYASRSATGKGIRMQESGSRRGPGSRPASGILIPDSSYNASAMTFHELQMLLEYHYWARDRLLDAIAPLTPDQLTADRGNSFPSIHATIVHLYGADWIWLSRWEGVSPEALPHASDFPDLASVRAAWDDVEARLRALVDRLGEEGIQRPIEYRRPNGVPEAQLFWQMFQHLVNHGSYHRGQVTTMLRQIDMAPPKSLDLIAFYRERAAIRT